MENNNYNETDRNRTDSTINGTGSSTDPSSGTGTNGGQQETSSTYRYSYMDQDQKNPNNIWRADDHTVESDSAYTSGTYTGQSVSGGTYTGQTGTNSAYTDPSSAYNGYGSANGSAYNTQAGGTNGAYGTQANGSYVNQNANTYSNIYGTQNTQESYQSYQSDKAQKKAERARKRAEKQASGGSQNFGVKLAKCASIALVFGLVAGTAFEGSSYVAGSLFGTNEKQQQEALPGEEKDIVKTTEGTDSLPVQPTAAASDGVVSIVKQCMPSIVSITNTSQVQIQNFFGQVQRYEVPSAGSGIIISEDDDYLYVATNNHVVASADTLSIQFSDSTTASAEIKGTDRSTDLAVVKVKKSDLSQETLSAIKVASFGDSDQLEVGSQAIAIGNALGYGQSVTAGYVSAVEREVTIQDETTGESFTNNLIQTDAAINPGNSGGALLNNKGEVIGINSSKYSDTDVEGMGFAIPANMAKPIIEDLITKEVVTGDKAAYLGITGDEVPSAILEAYHLPDGVFVKEVGKGTAAEQYGVETGDIITKFDGKEVKNMAELQKRISYCEAGTEVEIVVQRYTENGFAEKTLKVTLGQKNTAR